MFLLGDVSLESTTENKKATKVKHCIQAQRNASLSIYYYTKQSQAPLNKITATIVCFHIFYL